MTDATEAAARVRAFFEGTAPMYLMADLRALLASHEAQAAEIARLRSIIEGLQSNSADHRAAAWRANGFDSGCGGTAELA